MRPLQPPPRPSRGSLLRSFHQDSSACLRPCRTLRGVATVTVQASGSARKQQPPLRIRSCPLYAAAMDTDKSTMAQCDEPNVQLGRRMLIARSLAGTFQSRHRVSTVNRPVFLGSISTTPPADGENPYPRGRSALSGSPTLGAECRLPRLYEPIRRWGASPATVSP